ncbi:FAD:protein FMN transferase [Roseibium sp. MMSF_3544]|uniref:FAD:protein FMN transferase n=1 Tax=unclassified Roseibium TaxID=2629323 RepID=UPI00273EBC71|nr:FAD:protein FMN transferase [Roseibium sp. MMSF_3544]
MKPSRRRFLTIMAGCVLSATAARAGGSEPVRWRGRALGAEADIQLFGTDRAKAAQALAAARDTILRMESLFSLYKANSALNRLNDSGFLSMAPEFARLMRRVDRINRQTDGLFDPSIQPLMVAEAEAGKGMSAEDRRSLAARIGWDKVQLQPAHISFSRPGMAMTLNGIAQGFATDRVSEVLRTHGFDSNLVHIGEFRAGTRNARIGVANASGAVVEAVDLKEAALATSAPFGTRFLNGQGHIVRPDLTQAALRWQSVTVKADTATAADGLSTALALTNTPALAERIVAEGVAQAIWLEEQDGTLVRI